MTAANQASSQGTDAAPGALAKTYAVVVTFRPEPEATARQFDALAGEGIGVVVVDNNSPGQSGIMADARARGFEFIALDSNRGVAGAQNAGIERVKALKGEYVVLLDQDSVPQAGAVRSLLDALLTRSTGATPAAVGSSYTLSSGKPGSSFVRFAWFGFRKIYCNDGADGLREVDFLISSGTVIPLSVIANVGMMNDALFIDHVDTEWFLRARSMGYRSFGSCSARMIHALGERTVRIWFGRWRTVPVHKAFRYYFIFRNSIWLYRQRYAPLQWITADLVRLLYILVFSTVFIPSRLDNLKWMSRGVRDGFRQADEWDSAGVVRASVDAAP